jgi:hypothetical protein
LGEFVDRRIKALRRFAVSITAFNIVGHLFLGFEQPWAQPIVALGAAYALELAFEVIEATLTRRPMRFAGGLVPAVNFLLPAHITALAIGMLLYANSRLTAVVFAVAVAISSKVLFRVHVNGSLRHVFNPSNFGITVTLLVFSWVGISPPYHFTERISGVADWLVPAAILAAGLMLNIKLTAKGPLIAAWVVGFVAQAIVRSAAFDTRLIAALAPMTGVAFVLYTNYMITDPGTTPVKASRQVLFGAAVAATYGVLVAVHVVFGLFFALTVVSGIRALAIGAANVVSESRTRRARPIPAAAIPSHPAVLAPASPSATRVIR